MRVILYTGKGGVGKTSVAAATALLSAELGYRTIILSADAAHSLSDSFDTSLGDEPQPIMPNLWGQEPDITQTMEKHWGTLREWVAALLTWRGLNEIMASEMAVLPGMEELANLLYIVDYAKSGQYDVIIVDCAPTGETLRLLSFPEVMRWWMEKVFPIERKMARVLRPVLKSVISIPFPKEEVFDSVEDLFGQLAQMHIILSDPKQTSVRLVLNPEKMVIKETQRTFTYLNLYGYATDLVVCNRLIPDRVDDRYFDSWKANQARYYQLIEECFAPIPILSIPLLDQEVVGKPMLRLMGETLFGSDDPSRIFFCGQAQQIEKEDGYFILTLFLPFLSKEDISLVRNGDELIVVAGKHRRNIILPHILVGMSVKGAKFEGERLRIRFEEKQKS